MIRTNILKEAEVIIGQDRNGQYGEPENNFKEVARLWEDYLDHPIEPKDVAIMMTLLKIARIKTSEKYKADTYVDACGYMACAAEVAHE